MDPQITHLMPVLSSPLLTIHVSVIMMAFALLSLTFIIGCWELGVRCCSKLFRSSPYGEDMRGASLSQLFLYPAMTIPRYDLPRTRHLHWRHLGEHLMGNLLELGPEGDMGAHHLHGVCYGTSQSLVQVVEQPSCLSSLHGACFPHNPDDLFWRQLFPRRHALVCIGVFHTK